MAERALRTITPRDLGDDWLVTAIHEPQWRQDALCDKRGDEFFPEGRPPQRLKETCAKCPVRAECEEFALESPWQPYGIWGGKTSTELMPEWASRHEGASA
jgi:hypothetical protein